MKTIKRYYQNTIFSIFKNKKQFFDFWSGNVVSRLFVLVNKNLFCKLLLNGPLRNLFLPWKMKTNRPGLYGGRQEWGASKLNRPKPLALWSLPSSSSPFHQVYFSFLVTQKWFFLNMISTWACKLFYFIFIYKN